MGDFVGWYCEEKLDASHSQAWECETDPESCQSSAQFSKHKATGDTVHVFPYLAAEGFIEFLVLLKVYNFYLRVGATYLLSYIHK